MGIAAVSTVPQARLQESVDLVSYFSPCWPYVALGEVTPVAGGDIDASSIAVFHQLQRDCWPFAARIAAGVAVATVHQMRACVYKE